MGYRLGAFADVGLSEGLLEALLREHEERTLPTLRRFWSYYRNPAVGGSGRRVRLAQERGLPARLTGGVDALRDDRSAQGREVVIENDIAWRIHTMVDFMFGRPVGLSSAAGTPARRSEIEALLRAALEASGGVSLLQDVALLGAVYGHVDLLVRTDELFVGSRGLRGVRSVSRALELARLVRVEVIEPTRGVPLLSPRDFRRIDAMIVRYQRAGRGVEREGIASRVPWLNSAMGGRPRRSAHEVLEILSARRRQLYEDGRLLEDAPNPLGVLPVVHIQNTSQPFAYEGVSEVEPLIPLQDELNTRLSDRANRVTMQSFRMYLAKGVEGFAEAPVGPGQVWSTENPEASVEAIGGDAASPSEDAHIEELREAMDKASSITPVAAGVLRARLGSLSSENALRITLLGALSKTARRHVTYGRGLEEVCALILRALDAAGVYSTREEERGVRVRWPDPVPRDESARLEAARLKIELGVAPETALGELGYAPRPDGGDAPGMD
ncbi:MAG: phage portal protein [Phycisphaerales bacterium]|nr:MAG: phage portal protein [Phycisphaerales bacterium]